MSSKEKFGTPLGTAPGGVVAFSSNYKTADPSEFPTRRHYIGAHDGIYTGYRFQCVEFARRWLIQTHRMTFEDVGMAYEIFSLPALSHVDREDEPVEVIRTKNGTPGHLPVLGSILLWHPGGYFEHTGHVAIVTHCDLERKKVGVAEQNVTDRKWEEGKSYARELDISVHPETGAITIEDNHWWRTRVLGWVTAKPIHEAHTGGGRRQTEKRSSALLSKA